MVHTRTRQIQAAETRSAQAGWWTQTGIELPSSASLTQQDSGKKSLQNRQKKGRRAVIEFDFIFGRDRSDRKRQPPPGAINTWHFSSLLWNFRLMTPGRCTWVRYLQSSWFIKVPHLFSFNCNGQKKTSDDDFHTKLHALCASSAWWCRTLTFFEEGNHFINNILELPIRPAEKKNIQISSCQLNTLTLRDFKIDFEIVKKAAIIDLLNQQRKAWIYQPYLML